MPKFYSRYSGYTVQLKPHYSQMIDGQVMLNYGKVAKFKDGKFETDDVELAEMLKANPAFGVDFWEDKDPKAVAAEILSAMAAPDGGPVDKDNVATCPKCGRQFANAGALALHMRACKGRTDDAIQVEGSNA